jgi:hypothetical protein
MIISLSLELLLLSFTPPDLLNIVSLGHKCGPYLADKDVTMTYLLLSAAGAVTNIHVDQSATAVMYTVVRGEKWVYTIPGTRHNRELLEAFQADPATKKEFFPSHKLLEGKCVRTRLLGGQTIFLGPGMIHMVETIKLTVSIGVNIVHTSALCEACDAFVEERTEETPYDECYPSFMELGTCYLTMAMNGLGDEPQTINERAAFIKMWDSLCGPRGEATTTEDILDLCSVHEYVQFSVCIIGMIS